MSIKIPCENCGERSVEEFVYGEVPVVPDEIKAQGGEEYEFDFGYMHNNTLKACSVRRGSTSTAGGETTAVLVEPRARRQRDVAPFSWDRFEKDRTMADRGSAGTP